MKLITSGSQKGSILILALWALVLLSIFAISIGAKIQQKIILAGRVEKRSALYFAAEAGVKKAIGLLKAEWAKGENLGKIPLSNRPELFKAISMGTYTFDVFAGDDYGIVDEERKININKADESTLKNLLQDVSDLTGEQARDLAESIIDWRTPGESTLSSFSSDEYYDNLEFPYEEKKADFEILDELNLVKGVTPALYRQISPYLTVYGEGKANVNSASEEVLLAVGFTKTMSDQLIMGRRGADGEEATADDLIFPSGVALLPALHEFFKTQVKDDKDEMTLLAELFNQNKIDGRASFFMIRSRGYKRKATESMDGSKKDLRQENKVIACVFDLNSDKIQYWHEE